MQILDAIYKSAESGRSVEIRAAGAGADIGLESTTAVVATSEIGLA